jgi:hypothetical protein
MDKAILVAVFALFAGVQVRAAQNDVETEWRERAEPFDGIQAEGTSAQGRDTVQAAEPKGAAAQLAAAGPHYAVPKGLSFREPEPPVPRGSRSYSRERSGGRNSLTGGAIGGALAVGSLVAMYGAFAVGLFAPAVLLPGLLIATGAFVVGGALWLAGD